MDVLGPFHPQIVHFPIVLLIFSALFALAGRAMDSAWMKKTGTTLLIVGYLGTVASFYSGKPAHRVPERKQGVPEEAIDSHGDLGEFTVWVAGAAVAATLIAGRMSGGAASAVGGLGLLLQIAAAVMVGVTAHRGGKLVYEHGANVKIHGQLVRDSSATGAESEDAKPPGAP